MQRIKIISVSSLAAHKTASIKAQIAILGSAILPVPTVILNGVASFPVITKQNIDFMPILEGVLHLSIFQGQKPFLFVGYLTVAEDIKILADFIERNRNLLSGVLVDPISGDNDIPYIDSKIIAEWPKLLALADFAFPNLTELKLYSGLSENEKDISNHISAFEKRFPELNYIITSYADIPINGVLLKFGNKHYPIYHKNYSVKLDGTGDVFVAYFIKYHLLENRDPLKSCKKALDITLRHIKKSIKQNIAELEI